MLATARVTQAVLDLTGFGHRLGHHFMLGARDHGAKRMPAEVVRENVWASTQFEGEVILEFVSKVVGSDRIMWGSDYPHPDSTFPNTRKWIRDSFGSLNRDDAGRILGGNVAKLYKVDTKSLVRARAEPVLA